jgi:lincosamide nucleotidyltransferase A/C/D/E
MWIDGGRGVDALLGKQTRQHGDLDSAIQQKDIPNLRKLLVLGGYQEIALPDSQPWNFIIGNCGVPLIDIHVIVFDDAGNGIYEPVENGMMYPAISLTGMGVICERPVRFISAEDMLRFHSGYPLRESGNKSK